MDKRIFSNILIFIVLIAPFHVFAQNTTKISEQKLIFADDFKNDSIGGYPHQWKGNAKAVIETNINFNGRWMKLQSQGTYVPLFEKVLPETFAVEFDYIYEVNGSGNNSTELTFFNRQNQTPLDADFPGEQGVKIYLGDFLVSYLCYNNSNISDKTAGENRSVTIDQHNVTKVRIEIRKELVKLQINGDLVLKIQRSAGHQSQFNTFRLSLWGSVAAPLIGNFMISEM